MTSLLAIHVGVMITDVYNLGKTLLQILGEHFHLTEDMLEILARKEEAGRQEVTVIRVHVLQRGLPHTEGQHGGADLTQLVILEGELEQTPCHGPRLSNDESMASYKCSLTECTYL